MYINGAQICRPIEQNIKITNRPKYLWNVVYNRDKSLGYKNGLLNIYY